MEDWEIELRNKLDKELEDGLYTIGVGKYLATTGKQGKINFEVTLFKKIKGYNQENTYELKRENSNKEYLKEFTVEVLEKMISDLMYKDDRL